MTYNQLTREQRYAIYLGLQANEPKSAIARRIGVHPSTVTREVARNCNRFGHYGWEIAHERALDRRDHLPGNRGKPEWLMRRCTGLLRAEQWSPQQISGWLLLTEGVRISHETIYKWVRQDKDTGGTLWLNCRHRMRYRHRQPFRPKETKAPHIPDRVSIHDRPAEADGKRFGDWEMDLIVGREGRSHILTLCEKSTGYLIMDRVDGRDPKSVAETASLALRPYKRSVLTITTDNGLEFREHKTIRRNLAAAVYFTDAYSAWQKGAIENANKLIRQYIPKGTDFNILADEEIRQVQYKLNRRPRRKLGYSNPKIEFFKRL